MSRPALVERLAVKWAPIVDATGFRRGDMYETDARWWAHAIANELEAAFERGEQDNRAAARWLREQTTPEKAARMTSTPYIHANRSEHA